MSKKKKSGSRGRRRGPAGNNQFLMGALAGAVVAYLVMDRQSGPVLPPVIVNPGIPPIINNPVPATSLMGLPPQPITIRQMSATYIP